MADREQLARDAQEAAQVAVDGRPVADYPTALSMVPQPATINLGFQNDEEGRHVAVIAHVHVLGVAVLIGLDAEYAKAVGAALIEHAAQLVPPGPQLAVATEREVEHVRRTR